MPVQQQNASFAKGLGGRVAGANTQHKDAPIDTGNQRLPANIKNGIAKLSTLYTKEQDREDGKCPKGKVFFRASAIVVSPQSFNGVKVADLVTQQVVPLCDVPAKGKREAKSLEENWYDFQNLFKILGVNPPEEHGKDEEADARIQRYYFGAMANILERIKTQPIFIVFSTRGWTPGPTPENPQPNEMIFEDWHRMATAQEVAALFAGGNGRPDPAAGVGGATPATQPGPGTAPPTQTAPAPRQATTTPVAEEDIADVVQALVEVAMGDPNGETEDGANAGRRLFALAVNVGWPEPQVHNAPDWAAVGEMALGTPPSQAPAVTDAPASVTVGSKWMFCKRAKDGTKLKNAKGEELPPQEVEVTAVNAEAKTCTVKLTKDGKVVSDLRSKTPVDVKFDWLEVAQPPY